MSNFKPDNEEENKKEQDIFNQMNKEFFEKYREFLKVKAGVKWHIVVPHNETEDDRRSQGSHTKYPLSKNLRSITGSK